MVSFITAPNCGPQGPWWPRLANLSEAPVMPCRGLPGCSMLKNLPAKQEMWVRSLGQEDPLEKEMATHSNILAWEMPWTEKPGGLQSMGSPKSQTWLNDETTIMPCHLLMMNLPSEWKGLSFSLHASLLLIFQGSHQKWVPQWDVPRKPPAPRKTPKAPCFCTLDCKRHQPSPMTRWASREQWHSYFSSYPESQAELPVWSGWSNGPFSRLKYTEVMCSAHEPFSSKCWGWEGGRHPSEFLKCDSRYAGPFLAVFWFNLI